MEGLGDVRTARGQPSVLWVVLMIFDVAYSAVKSARQLKKRGMSLDDGDGLRDNDLTSFSGDVGIGNGKYKRVLPNISHPCPCPCPSRAVTSYQRTRPAPFDPESWVDATH